MSADRDLEARVARDVQAAIGDLGLLVDDLSIVRAGKRRLVRIAVDDDLSGLAETDETGPVPPVALDTVAAATRAIDAALDASDVMGQAPYILEVGSPGMSRPLSEVRHFRRNVGRLVRLQLGDGSQVTGRIVRAGPADLTILAEPAARRTGAGRAGAGKTGAGKAGAPTPAQERVIAYADITRAEVQVEFGSAGTTPHDTHELATHELDMHDEQED